METKSEENMGLSFQAHCSACHNFLKDMKEQTRTVWLVPVAVKRQRNKLLISWACSLGNTCQSEACIYSRRDEKAPEQ